MGSKRLMEPECLTDVVQMGIIGVNVFVGVCLLLIDQQVNVVKQFFKVHEPLVVYYFRVYFQCPSRPPPLPFAGA